METITFKGKEYPTRTFNVILDGDNETTEIIITTYSLSDAMGDDKEINDTEANDIDNTIYFYVENSAIDLDADVICQNHLDEPMEFVEELFK